MDDEQNTFIKIEELKNFEKARCEEELAKKRKASKAEFQKKLNLPVEFPTTEELSKKILKETNKYRRMHCACPLVLRLELSQLAQIWADDLAAKNLLETHAFPRYGENIMCVRHDLMDIPRLIKLWYQEKYDYEYAKPCFSPYTGHFTQMIWWDTKELGVGIARDTERTWIVCMYRPFGNIAGQYQENVLPRKLMLSSSESDLQEALIADKPKKKCTRFSIETKPKKPRKIRCWQFERRPCERNPDYNLPKKNRRRSILLFDLATVEQKQKTELKRDLSPKRKKSKIHVNY